MSGQTDLSRFTEAQETSYAAALAEIKQGRKLSHWMWYIFPQVQGLGFSSTSKYYAIKDLDEAAAYLKHPVLGSRLVEISQALMALENDSAKQIFGDPDDMKLRSSMTLFAAVRGADPVFEAVLKKFFDGRKDGKTLQLLGQV